MKKPVFKKQILMVLRSYGLMVLWSKLKSKKVRNSERCHSMGKQQIQRNLERVEKQINTRGISKFRLRTKIPCEEKNPTNPEAKIEKRRKLYREESKTEKPKSKRHFIKQDVNK